MRLAIMQPYLFPYIGYFQLINAVEKFVLYENVNYIKRSWIKGVAYCNGRFVGPPMVLSAKKIIEKYKLIKHREKSIKSK